MNSLLLAVLLLGQVPAPAATNVANDAALSQAARNYRLQIYETFRTNRPEYDRRRLEAYRVEDAWRTAGALDKDLPKLIDWYREAEQHSRSGLAESLPPVPEFGRTAEVPKINKIQPPVAEIEKPREIAPPATPPLAAPEAKRLATEHRPTVPSITAPKNAVEESSSATTLPANKNPAVPTRTAVSERNLPATNTNAAGFSPALNLSKSTREGLEAAPPTTAEMPAVVADRVPAAPAVHVNEADFQARTAGYRRALRTLEQDLLAEQSWSANNIEPLLKTCEDLVRRRGSLFLYERVVSPESQTELQKLAWPAEAVSLLAQRVFQARQNATNDAERGAEDRQSELDALDALSLRLSNLTPTGDR